MRMEVRRLQRRGKKNLDTNENRNTIPQNLWATAKAV